MESRTLYDASLSQRGQTTHGGGRLHVLCLAGARSQRHHRGTGLLTQTSVGKINGRSIDARTYQSIVQQSIDARQRQNPGAMGLEDYQQVRDEVWDQIVQSSVLDAEYRRRGIQVSDDEIVQAIRTSPLTISATSRNFRPTASSTWPSTSAG